MEAIRIKTVSVGDHGCDKTCLMFVACKNAFPHVYCPTLFDSYVADLQVDGKQMEVAPWDTADETEQQNRLRPLSYPGADAILMCFALDSPQAFANIETKWTLEILQFCRHVPIILIGTKKDVRDSILPPSPESHVNSFGGGKETDGGATQFVTYEQGRALADKIGTYDYLECGAKNNEGIHAILPTAARAALQARQRKKQRKCHVV